MDSILSIQVRDARHPCAPYETTGHSFFVQIYHCDSTPLFYKGINFGVPQLLHVRGRKNGFIHGQFKVPPGCYVIRAIATCHNVTTDWAMVGVGCGETKCVSLLPTSLRHCIFNMIAGLKFGTAAAFRTDAQVMAATVAANEVDVAIKALEAIAAKLPEHPLPDPPDVEEIKRMEKEAKEAERSAEEDK